MFAIDRIPSDNQIRAMLDPVEPAQFAPAFAAALSELEQSGAIDQLRVLSGHLLIALDGSEYYGSTERHCPNCSTRKRGKGEVEYHHSLPAATLVCPGHNHAVPLEPEFIVPQDGHEKQDCESRAMRRWLAAHGARYARLKPIGARNFVATAGTPVFSWVADADVVSASAWRPADRPSQAAA